jgi:5-methylcytosine-specific restriction endonuclease McrA
MSGSLIESVGWLWRKWRQYVPRGSQPSEEQISAFYWTPEWWEQRQATIKKYGKKCMRCGHTGSEGNPIRVDHIKPVRHHWGLRLDPSNLQVLCNEHNMEKGSWDETDWRPQRLGLFGLFKK